MERKDRYLVIFTCPSLECGVRHHEYWFTDEVEAKKWFDERPQIRDEWQRWSEEETNVYRMALRLEGE